MEEPAMGTPAVAGTPGGSQTQAAAGMPAQEQQVAPGVPAATGTLHHIELWVPDLPRAVASWGWLLGELGYVLHQEWPEGRSWRSGATYIVVEQSPARTALRHDRCRPGLNHLAFHVSDPAHLDEMVAGAPERGWSLLFADRHPYAGGDGHYAAYLENRDGYEVELVAPDRGAATPTAGGP